MSARLDLSAPASTEIPPSLYHLAQTVELDRDQVLRWYAEDPIQPLGSLTAEALVAIGKADQVMAFLRDVSRSERPSWHPRQDPAGVMASG